MSQSATSSSESRQARIDAIMEKLRPKMDEAVRGYRAGLSTTLPCDWLGRAWSEEAA